MKLIINGEPREVPEGHSVTALLADLGFRAGGIALEHNGAILDAAQFATTTLAEGDNLELIRFVGGG